jgi:hypothetical protein
VCSGTDQQHTDGRHTHGARTEGRAKGTTWHCAAGVTYYVLGFDIRGTSKRRYAYISTSVSIGIICEEWSVE